MIDKQEYNEQGFVLLRNFLDPVELDVVRNEAKEIFLIQLRRNKLIESFNISEAEFEAKLYELFRKDFQQIVYCGKQAQHLISLHRLALNEKIISALTELGLAFPIINVRPVIFFNSRHLGKRDVDWKKPSHQDWKTTQGSLDSTVVWMPLIDIDKSLGALEIAPKSHQLGLLDYEMQNDYHRIVEETSSQLQFVSVEVKKGDALFFSTLLVHRSGNNTSDSIRWSCHFRYNNLYEPTFIERGFPHSYIYKPQDELITPGFPSRDDVEQTFSRK
jgi:ectoine hydroxylase-related dioxygenase (phytanoyl-CoA dioxygenase family)